MNLKNMENKEKKPELIIPPEIKDRILAERKVWYNFIPAKLEMIKLLQKKELAFLSAKSEKVKSGTRFLICHHSDFWDKNLERYGFFKYLLNAYCSCADLENIPKVSWNLQRRNDPAYKDFNENYSKFVIGFDVFFDLDGKEDFNKCLEETKAITKILSERKIPFYILPSSFLGFHIVIPSIYVNSQNLEIHKLINKISEVIFNFKGVYDFETLDDSVTDMKRIRVLPYSMKTDCCCCIPLSDNQLNSFSSEILTLKNVMSKIFIKNRGLLIRTYNLDSDTLKKNVDKFFKDFE